MRRMTGPINAIVVHCSATPGGKPFTAADIDRWHRKQGWEGIGYHFVIRVDGMLEPGRPLEFEGAHVAGHNERSIAICLIGGADKKGRGEDNFLPEQYATLEAKLKHLRGHYPEARILGHRDYPGVRKDCPSFDVSAWCKAHGIDPNPARGK